MPTNRPITIARECLVPLSHSSHNLLGISFAVAVAISARENTVILAEIQLFLTRRSGAGGETRTPNRPITNRVLYQLSHASI